MPSAMTERVKVIVRVRPFLPSDGEVHGTAMQIKDSRKLLMKGRGFKVDSVYDVSDSTSTIFYEQVSAMVDRFLSGYNATVMAYGQTGTGKTFTISELLPLVMHRIVEEGFNGNPRSLRFQYIEVYGDTLRDLLAADPAATASSLRLYDEYNGKNSASFENDSKTGKVFVSGANVAKGNTIYDILSFINMGSLRRATAATKMNEDSSRSHSILTIQNCNTNAKFHLVDLAGSERNKKTENTGIRLKESIGINTGLLALGNVIRALHRNATGPTNSTSHVPYRSSKLTRLLRDSIGGNSLTLFIACVAPNIKNSDETLRTLQYCALAQYIVNEPTKAVAERISTSVIPSAEEHMSVEEMEVYQDVCELCLLQEEELLDAQSELAATRERLSVCESELDTDRAVFIKQMEEIKRLVNYSRDLEMKIQYMEPNKADEDAVQSSETTTDVGNFGDSASSERMYALTRQTLAYQNENAELRNKLASAITLIDAQQRENSLLRLEIDNIHKMLHT